MNLIIYFNFFYLIFLSIGCSKAEVIKLDNSNLDSILKGHEVVLVNFYADWCRFSQMLAPIFQEAAIKIKEKFPEPGKVAVAKVDCDKETNIAAGYQVSKYPTLKVFKMGQVMKKEYRGQRSSEAFVQFVQEQLKDPIGKTTSADDLDNLDFKRRHIIGYFDNEQSPDYAAYKKVAAVLKADCDFHSLFSPHSDRDRVAGNKIVYRPAVEDYNEMVYQGSVSDESVLLKWTTDKCIPLVRQITFENAEELTEEGMPFMILFHHPDDLESPERFKKHVAVELLSEKNHINFLLADGLKFTHPLHHLGKSLQDLPIIAIDSFKHMYVWHRTVKDDLEKQGALLQFIQDLRSGKLHREFHNGPDPAAIEPPKDTPPTDDPNAIPSSEHIPLDKVESVEPLKDTTPPTSPPESLFKKLAPSKDRYTLLKDEL